MKSLAVRLAEQKDEVLDVTRNFGRWVAMEKFQVADYTCFAKWLEEVTGDENFGLTPTINPSLHQTLGDQLAEAFLRKVATLKAELADRDKRITLLEWQLSQTETKEMTQALAILQTCEVQ